MPDLVIIAPMEMAHGFRLAGVDVMAARNLEQARDFVSDLKDREEVDIVLLPEEIFATSARSERQDLLQHRRPYFVPMPMDWRGTRDERAELEQHLRQILGYAVAVTDHLLNPRGEDT